MKHWLDFLLDLVDLLLVCFILVDRVVSWLLCNIEVVDGLLSAVHLHSGSLYQEVSTVPKQKSKISLARGRTPFPILLHQHRRYHCWT